MGSAIRLSAVAGSEGPEFGGELGFATGAADRLADLQRLARRALEYTSMFNMPMIEHCEDQSLKGDGVAHEVGTPLHSVAGHLELR